MVQKWFSGRDDPPGRPRTSLTTNLHRTGLGSYILYFEREMVSNIEVMEVGIGNFTEDKKDNEELPMKMGVVFCISSSSSVFAIFVFFV